MNTRIGLLSLQGVNVKYSYIQIVYCIGVGEIMKSPEEHRNRLLMALSGLNDIRTGSKLVLIGSLILAISISLLIFTMGSWGMIRSYRHGVFSMIGLLAQSLYVLALFIVGIIIVLWGIHMGYVPGVRDLAEYDRSKYNTASMLIYIGYLWGSIFLLIGLLTIPILIGIFIIPLGLLLFTIGHIGSAILMFQLGGEHDSSSLFFAAVIFLLSIVLPIIWFIAWILVYTGVSSVRKSIREQLDKITTGY